MKLDKIRVRNKSGQEGTVIGQSSDTWYVHWDGKKYGQDTFGATPRDQVEILPQHDRITWDIEEALITHNTMLNK